ncbi:MAG: dissimilatory-type sulfite reductase subunit alpha [Chlorobium phaeobacteroides]|uniref:Sulfite reductase, dissimilatory-type alpha subunit n=1 Tax=Chlorobium phaeobacteroides (strain BS1) TaxID=331678 RepID=B3ELT3_CHLPB|nr:dissimilatory-type sulfite reductase subunit alpha [Chlorobium phaeobacteroides]MBL6956087.1 dissimilatory-type sulfite reductase subunit alpha [Chlorobium phaeobacteroides]
MGDANGAGSNGSGNGKFLNPTPMLDELESGPWPSFVTGLKDLAERTKKPMLRGVMDQLEYSYQTRMGYWKGGLVTVKGYGAGIITRYSMIRDKLPEASEFHTMRIQAPPGLHYNTESLRELCDIWEKHGTGLITLHGQTGDIMLQGIEADKVQECFDELNQKGWDLGGAGAGMRTGVSCAGPARCEQACYDTLEMHEKVMKHFVGAVHRPEWNYKFKLKFSGCPNDCTNAIMRSDIAVIGMWRDSIQMDESAVKEWVDENGMEKLVNEVVSLCPTRAISLKEGGIAIDNGNCVHCMHCLNVMPKALSPGKERGVALLMGAKSTLKVGFNVGSMVVPFMKMETEEDIEEFIDLADEIIDWWDDNGLDHERLGETIERVSMKQFLDGVGLEPSIDMVSRPRDNPYFKTKY